MWRLDILQDPKLNILAAPALAEADLLIISLRGEGNLPTKIRALIDERLAQTTNHDYSRKHEKQVRALYLDLSPEALVVERVGVNAVVDCGEFERARWFWKRQPSKLVLSILKALKIVIFYVVLFVLLIA